MKLLTILTLAAFALSLGACAHHEPSSSTSTMSHSTSTGYSK